ncbi:DEAD/DEAH box helicase [Saccharothrix variisporea]|uniref:DEAD/DEAH box helicase n=1 Tax=Saccharothrix variisporea TaxID=543527 RepID=UPI0037CA5058
MVPDEDRELRRTAEDVFGWSELRPDQLTAMRHVLDGRDTLVVMPTGAGKSAVYQVPAVLRDGPTVVVSPLVALQRDQVAGLRENDAPAAAAVNSAQPEAANDRAWRSFSAARTEYLFLSPEQLAKRTCSTASPPPACRCSWWTRPTASRPGATTSAPTTCAWGRWWTASATRPWWR